MKKKWSSLLFQKKNKKRKTNCIYHFLFSKEDLNAGDRVLIIDDFLANGAALSGLKALVEQAGGTVVGAGILIEKKFQGGGDALRAKGMRIESLACIEEMTDDGGIRFC